MKKYWFILSILLFAYGCMGNSDGAYGTVDAFYRKISQSDFDSLSTICTQVFLDNNDTDRVLEKVDEGKKDWGAYKGYSVNSYDYSYKNNQGRYTVCVEVMYSKQTNYERLTLIPENDTVKILYYEVNPPDLFQK